MSLDDMNNKKTIPVLALFSGPTQTPTSSLSVISSTALPFLMYAGAIERKAVELLNSKNAIVSEPSLSKDKRGNKYLVAGYKLTPYSVIKAVNGNVTCNCKGFQFARICKHAVALARKSEHHADLLLPMPIKKEKLGGRPINRKGLESMRLDFQVFPFLVLQMNHLFLQRSGITSLSLFAT